MDKKQLYQFVCEIICPDNVLIDEPMAKHTSFKVGGPADIFIKINTLEQLRDVIKLAKDKSVPLHIVGNGSNLLVKDGGIRGITAKLDFKDIQAQSEGDCIMVTVGAGTALGFLAQKLLQQEVTGFEFAAGIPGTIGGAVLMNAGAHGR